MSGAHCTSRRGLQARATPFHPAVGPCRSRNPFVDRTAEKTELDDVSLYMHSDLQGFKPSGALAGGVTGQGSSIKQQPVRGRAAPLLCSPPA